jgi:ADP-dependent NAD(P)H-hydrate dehydratase / NAD(P)H-hydrate epimerase
MDAASVRALDRAAIDRFAIPAIVLMENAALGILPAARAMLPSPESEVVIFCGPGNNGGDGLALARHLSNEGTPVRVVLLSDHGRYSAEAAINLRILQSITQKIPNLQSTLVLAPPRSMPSDTPGLVIDAMFGTGLIRPLEGFAREAAEWIASARAQGTSVLSVDVPSGLDADTGRPLGKACVRADATVTLAAVKPGLTKLEAQGYVGELSVASIGVPEALLAEFGKPWTPPPGLGRLAD